jgi:Protein of unknown function (DUF2735)
MINTGLNRASAKIYDFPVGGRDGVARRRDGDTRTPLELAASQVNLADCSSSWYHQAAIQESKPTHEH